MTIDPRELAARREALIATSDHQRLVMREAMRGIRRGLAVADSTIAIARRLHRKPLAAGIISAAIALLIVSPRSAVRWLSYGLTGYSLVRQLRGIFARPPG